MPRLRHILFAAMVGLPLAPHLAEAAPPASRPSPTPLRERFAGTVVERLEAGAYSYLRVRPEAAAPEAWVVMMGAGPRLGARVAVSVFGEQRDFQSPRLGRRFERLLFAAVEATP